MYALLRDFFWGEQERMLVHLFAAKRRCGGRVFNESCSFVSTRLSLPAPEELIPPHNYISLAMPIELPSFYERGASLTFDPPTPQRGYLPQVNEKLGQWLSWDVQRNGGEPHLPIFICTPGWYALSYTLLAHCAHRMVL